MFARIRQQMTLQPQTIGADATLAYAEERMQQLNVRHLPVLRGGELVGMVSQRDLLLLKALDPDRVKTIKVEEAVAQDVFTVGPDAPLYEVAQQMAERRLGSALVIENGKVLGIFTTTDALAALARYAGPAAAKKAPRARTFKKPAADRHTKRV